LFSQELTTGFYPEPDESSLCPHILFLHVTTMKTWTTQDMKNGLCRNLFQLPHSVTMLNKVSYHNIFLDSSPTS